MWAVKAWCGSLYTRRAKPADYLAQYSSVFNTVEGNHTFYGVPSPDAIERWASEVPDGFRFCFKFPRAISHDYGLSSSFAIREARAFTLLMKPIREKLGLLFLQLPPGFGRERLPELETFLENLPRGYPYAVEVRNPDFHDGGEIERRFNDLLTAHKADRALFDTVLLHALPPDSPAIIEAQGKKPRAPECFTATGPHPFLRYVGHPEVEPNLERLDMIAGVVAGWIRDGRKPFVFMHSPGEAAVPELCRRFHQLLAAKARPADVGILGNFPGEREKRPSAQMPLL